MKVYPFIISALLTLGIIYSLNRSWNVNGNNTPVLAAFLSPQQGFWQNAEPVGRDLSETLSFPALKGKAKVFFDDRMVPHVFASTTEDAFFIQGYLHAKFRLWQMDFQTYAAAGRLCEIFGLSDMLNKADRYYRRTGIGYAAEKTLAVMESDPATKAKCDAYTAGVNQYIADLPSHEIPFEYKLFNYRPEPWTNLKTALFMKYMAYNLCGYDNDFENTALRQTISKTMYDEMVPLQLDSLMPIVQDIGAARKADHSLRLPAGVDTEYLCFSKDNKAYPMLPAKPDKDNGSNNWALDGKKTQSGYPILCNDPHMPLNMPSQWYEMQIKTPEFDVYGVSLPGIPSVIIGFNDSCAFGITNAERDVKDYYKIEFKDSTHKQYLFNGKWVNTDFRYEHIRIRNRPDFIDTVAYTIFGPVIFDEKYNSPDPGKDRSCYAVKWTAHEPSNDLKAFLLLDRAKNYQDYRSAIKFLHAPGQNIAFASKKGDIALWCQGLFPAKWRRQGDFVMPGKDSSYMWQAMINPDNNPHEINPERGFVSSANQRPADSTYPYYLGGYFSNLRALLIKQKLSVMQHVTPADMMQMQTDYLDVFARMTLPLFEQHLDESKLSPEEKKYWDIIKKWDLRDDDQQIGTTLFCIVWYNFEKLVWNDELERAKVPFMHANEEALIEGILKDTAFSFLDNCNTPQKETLSDDVWAAIKMSLPDSQFLKAHPELPPSPTPSWKQIEAEKRLPWGKDKVTRLSHLTGIPALGRWDLPVGGNPHCINAITKNHGPTWRMIVSLTPETEAYGVYAGGQSGNPGSPYYDSFTDEWARGKYYRLWMMKEKEFSDPRVKYVININE